MKTPLVEMNGDEMTRILWKMIKDELILPYIDLKTEAYDLGLPNRDETDDQVTVDAANAIKKYGVGVKCATITPNAQRKEEYDLKRLYKSPNATIRALLDGTVFRAPIVVEGIDPIVKCWEKPITLARHAYGDVYKAVEMRVDHPGTVKLVYEGEDGGQAVIHQVLPRKSLLLRKAAELAEQGLPFEDLCAELQACQKNTRLCFTLEHFDNLVNNGRMPPLAGTLLQTLGIRIVAEATAEGTIRVAKKARGEAHTARAIAQLMSDAKDCTGSHVIITHCQNPEGAERLRNAILDRLPVKAVEILPCRGLTSFYAMDKGLILSY